LRVIGVLVLAIVLCGSSAFAATPTRTILVFGDSLSAGYGLGDAAAWPQLLQRKLQESGYGAAVANASVSGETTSGGLARLPRALQQHRPQLVILELGANDGLRGLPLATVRDNLQSMINLIQQTGAKVLLLGIQLPPNYGPTYNTRFTEMFTQLAATQRKIVV
jgi:acyl-CoA thioesterase-1